jgi:hypothetical protein
MQKDKDLASLWTDLEDYKQKRRAERNDEDVNPYLLPHGNEAKSSDWSNVLGLPAPSTNEDPMGNQLALYQHGSSTANSNQVGYMNPLALSGITSFGELTYPQTIPGASSLTKNALGILIIIIIFPNFLGPRRYI